jgi:hypothetical protein
MRIILLTTALILLATICQTQNPPDQTKFIVGTDSIYLNPEQPNFKNDGFMLGWHWATPKKRDIFI